MKILKNFLLIVLFFGIILGIGNFFLPRLFPAQRFSGTLLALDTAAIESIDLKYFSDQKPNQISLVRTNSRWTATQENITVNAPKQVINSLLSSLSNIQADSLVTARVQSFPFKDFCEITCASKKKSDTKSFLIKNISDSLNLILLKWNKDSETYAAKSPIGKLISHGFSVFRDTSFLSFNAANVTKIFSSHYHSDTVFIFQKYQNAWKIFFTDSEHSDAALPYTVQSDKVDSLLDGFQRVFLHDFADDFSPEQNPNKAIVRLQMGDENDFIQIESFKNPNKIFANQQIVRSSQNPETYFWAKKSNFDTQLFFRPLQFCIPQNTINPTKSVE